MRLWSFVYAVLIYDTSFWLVIYCKEKFSGVLKLIISQLLPAVGGYFDPWSWQCFLDMLEKAVIINIKPWKKYKWCYRHGFNRSCHEKFNSLIPQISLKVFGKWFNFKQQGHCTVFCISSLFPLLISKIPTCQFLRWELTKNRIYNYMQLLLKIYKTRMLFSFFHLACKTLTEKLFFRIMVLE